MKRVVFLFLFLLPGLVTAQTKSNYAFVIVPEYFSFLSEKNQYNLNELTKFLLNKEGVTALYESEEKPIEFNFDKCRILQLDVTEENAFLSTKLKLTLTDCNRNTIAESVGSSKEKTLRVAYNYALRNAFNELKIPQNNLSEISSELSGSIQKENPSQKADFLYARKTGQGFSLSDADDVEKYKLFVSSNGAHFLISGQNKNGILYKNDEVWLFEYIQDEKVITETLKIKF